jgi:hypothetical protein
MVVDGGYQQPLHTGCLKSDRAVGPGDSVHNEVLALSTELWATGPQLQIPQHDHRVCDKRSGVGHHSMHATTDPLPSRSRGYLPLPALKLLAGRLALGPSDRQP